MVTKIAKVLAISIKLIFDEKLKSVLPKFCQLIDDKKLLHDKLDKLERENEKFKQVNTGFQKSLVAVQLKVNLDQQARKNNIIKNGIKETYAERTLTAYEDQGG